MNGSLWGISGADSIVLLESEGPLYRWSYFLWVCICRPMIQCQASGHSSGEGRERQTLRLLYAKIRNKFWQWLMRGLFYRDIFPCIASSSKWLQSLAHTGHEMMMMTMVWMNLKHHSNFKFLSNDQHNSRTFHICKTVSTCHAKHEHYIRVDQRKGTNTLMQSMHCLPLQKRK